jgi:hypothetical protein
MRPEPPVALVVCSVLVVAGCLASASVALAMMWAVAWDPCSFIGGGILLPIPSFLACRQYGAVAWSDSRAARTSAILLFLIGGLALLMFAVNLGEMINAKVRIPWFSLMAPLLGVGVFAISAAWMNLRWSRRLKLVATTSGDAAPIIRLSRRDALAGLSVVDLVAALVLYIVKSTPPQYAEHVAREQAPFGLPAGARDVSYCQGFRGTIAYEFTIDENRFVEWVESGVGSLESNAAGVPLKPIAEPFTITRYYALTKGREGPDSATIKDGLSYSWTKEDRGVYAAFDRATGRAYYFAHFH